MFAISVGISIIVGVSAGSALGIIWGFCMAGHRDVLSGFSPRTNNRFLLFVCRLTNNLNFMDAIGFLVLICTWLVLFILLVAAPIVVASKLDGENSVLVVCSMAAFFVTSYLARGIGERLWVRLL